MAGLLSIHADSPSDLSRGGCGARRAFRARNRARAVSHGGRNVIPSHNLSLQWCENLFRDKGREHGPPGERVRKNLTRTRRVVWQPLSACAGNAAKISIDIRSSLKIGLARFTLRFLQAPTALVTFCCAESTPDRFLTRRDRDVTTPRCTRQPPHICDPAHS